MIKFKTIGQVEKKYAFVDAIAKADVLNGTFGDVNVSGEFEAKAGKKAIMQVEVGDEAGTPTYHIKKGEHVRVVDLEKFMDEKIEIYGAQVPDGVQVGNKLVVQADGSLKVASASGFNLEVTKIIPNVKGVEVLIKNA